MANLTDLFQSENPEIKQQAVSACSLHREQREEQQNTLNIFVYQKQLIWKWSFVVPDEKM